MVIDDRVSKVFVTDLRRPRTELKLRFSLGSENGDLPLNGQMTVAHRVTRDELDQRHIHDVRINGLGNPGWPLLRSRTPKPF